MDRAVFEKALAQLPLYFYGYVDPKALEFSQRVRRICQQECPMYGKSWACPPGVGAVDDCAEKCRSYENCLLIGTVTQIETPASMTEALATRPDHEKITNKVRDLMREQGIDPYVLSSEACDICTRCACLDGLPCRMPGRMHPCVESHGINLIPTLEENGLEFQYGDNVITWYSLLLFND